jgi:MFS family permease
MGEAELGESRPRIWAKRALIGLLIVGLLVLAGFLGAAFIPRWWSHRVGDQVNGGIAMGIFLGLVYGFIFTALPLAVLWRGFRKRRPWKAWAAWAGVAILLALPNLFTLGIVLGSGKASHAGERTLDVEAPGFRGGSLAGAITAVVAFALLLYLLISGRRNRLRVRSLREQLKAKERESESSDPSAPSG